LQPHEVLEVNPGPTRAEVTDAFRRFALRHHPDRGGDPARFQAGVDAYHRLLGTDAPARRRPAPRADVVFHCRARPGARSLLRLAGRRLSATLSRP
jgi:hypothetical protein